MQIVSRWDETKVIFETKEAETKKALIIAAMKAGANLSGANLFGANLSRANLSGANLSRADLSEANLSRANLSGANLSRADLSEANLSRADLSEANLSRANLSRANLSGANLSRADLSEANLSRANLSRANLSEANLFGADLSGAKLEKTHGLFPIVPEVGAFTAFKKLANGVIARIQIPEDAGRVGGYTGRKCRAEKAIVLDGEGPSTYAAEFIYTVGRVVVPDSWDPDPRVECSHGIHFFLTRQEARDYD